MYASETHKLKNKIKIDTLEACKGMDVGLEYDSR